MPALCPRTSCSVVTVSARTVAATGAFLEQTFDTTGKCVRAIYPRATIGDIGQYTIGTVLPGAVQSTSRCRESGRAAQRLHDADGSRVAQSDAQRHRRLHGEHGPHRRPAGPDDEHDHLHPGPADRGSTRAAGGELPVHPLRGHGLHGYQPGGAKRQPGHDCVRTRLHVPGDRRGPRRSADRRTDRRGRSRHSEHAGSGDRAGDYGHDGAP